MSCLLGAGCGDQPFMSPTSLRAAALLGILTAVGCASHADGAKPADRTDDLAIPTLTDVNPDPSVVEVQIVATSATIEYLPGKVANVWAYRDGAVANSTGHVPGPMLVANRGDQVIVHFKNELPEPTTLHWHGIRPPIEADGSTSSQSPIPPGGTFDYRFRVEDSGSFWFHPHVRADQQIEKGLYAPLVVRGTESITVATDRYLVLDDVKLNADGQLSTETDAMDLMMGRQGNVLLVNGKRGATLEVSAGSRERWRLVNAANGRFFKLRLANHRFQVIGTDGGLLPRPYSTETLLIAPGERYDVLVTFEASEGTRAALETLHYDRGHHIPDPGPKPLMDVVYRAASQAAELTVPAGPPIEPLPVTARTPVRRFVLAEFEARDGTRFSINNEFWPFNNAIHVTKGALEVWEIVNDAEMDHPFHLHGMFFQVLKNGVPDTSLGWKDTVNVPQKSSLRFAVRYDALGMWMFHCHILEHAEHGMMGDLMVMPP